MTCRHVKGDPACSSSPEGLYRQQREQEAVNQRLLENRQKELEARTPNPDQYEIIEFARVGPHLVLKVKYPSCTACSYEGNKVLVLLDVPEDAAVWWRRIDPHFKEPGKNPKNESPSPAARFPASKEGWQDALEYARGKAKVHP